MGGIKGIFASSLGAGILLAISIQAGINASPEGLTVDVGEQITQQYNGRLATSWATIKFLVSVLVATEAVIWGISILYYGLAGVLAAIFGFVGGLAIWFIPFIGAIILIFTTIISLVSQNSEL